ncbi:hypothetical protein BGZ47_010273 [Haplosporangium gracile]|nr:hypothetical protein BGZ47_010273 [Haplosporangium gracile]
MTSIHPLELPEIITRVGHFLPLWSQERALGTGRLKLVFLPHTFYTCTLVSKCWHDTLVPLLWSYYDAEAMEIVPIPTLTRNSIHFRTFCQHRSYGRSSPTFFGNNNRDGGGGGCTRLTNATLNPDTIEELGETRHMVRNNGGLRSLEWHGPTGSTPLSVDDFRGLKKVERLNLSRWKVDGGRLWGILGVLAGSLKVLEIGWLTGADDDDDGDGQMATIMLPLLESYRSSDPSYGPDPAEFVKRCPNLVRSDLSLDTDKGYCKDDKDVSRLSDSLRTHCPKLRALTIKGSITPDQKAILIRSCTSIPNSSLLELVIDVHSMGKDLMDSISLHAPTLETLGILTTIEDEAIKMRSLLQLPVQCPRLEWFAVNAIYSREPARSILGALKAAAWQSSTMEILDLNAGDPSEASIGDGVCMLKDLFANGPILGWIQGSEDGLLALALLQRIRELEDLEIYLSLGERSCSFGIRLIIGGVYMASSVCVKDNPTLSSVRIRWMY